MSRHTHRLRNAIAGVVVLMAIAPAGAAARFDNNPIYIPAPHTARAIQVVQETGGFDWGDAGIGAAAGAGASILAIAGARGMSGRRARRTTGPATAGSS